MGERCRCGAELLPHLHFCVGCGADRPVGPPPPAYARGPVAVHGPAPAHRGTPWPTPAQSSSITTSSTTNSSTTAWAIVASTLLVVLVAFGAALFALRPDLLTGRSTAEAAPVVTAAAPSAPRASSLPAPSARETLAAQVDRDRTQVESVVGSWVPQLSSKRPGTVDAGVTYDDDAILGHYRGLAAQYPGTALLWSGDWPVFKSGDYWVVIVAQPFATAAQANAWCDRQGFGTDDCLAKNLSHEGGPAGTTVSR